jgi:retron-type reverse transcriptase
MVTMSPLIIPIFLPHAGCRQHCLFCNQKAIAKEIPSPSSVRKFIETPLFGLPSDEKMREKQIAFYGGSFTAMDREDQISYLKEVQPFLSSGAVDSIRVSTRPDALNEEIISLLKEYRVKIVEIGAQSMVDQVLLLSKRGHSAKDTISAISRLKQSRFEVGVHLQIGLPGDTYDHFLQTLDRIIDLKPNFIRIHTTLVLRGAPLEILWREGKYSPLSLDDAIVSVFEHRLEENLLALQNELKDKTYHPGPYVSFTIHEPKRRLISAAPFRDRVVHHALCNIIEPLFERTFVSDSYANRMDKGTHRALDRCQQFARRYRYVLQCDICQFFPSIDHEILAGILRRPISDSGVIWLIDRIMESGARVLSEEYEMVWFPGDNLFAVNRPRGLPIGNLTSQFWANCYLNPFDHFVKRELGCRGYIRYVDDILLFGEDKIILWKWYKAVVERLVRLRLTLHPGTNPRPVTEGIPFLGFIIYPDRRRLKRRKVVHFRRRFDKLVHGYEEGEVPLSRITASVQGWINHARYGNTVGLRKAVLDKIIIRSGYFKESSL